MKRNLSITIILLFLVAGIISLFVGIRRASAQSGTSTTPAAASSNSPAPAQPDANAAPAQPPKLVLQCQGCHGQGKTLPYLGGALFHTEAHKAYDHGFHAKAIQNGRRAAACLDCHSVNNDMTTILPPSDPKSTINRANIAATCGKCHGDPRVMNGSGISNQPFLAYQESVHNRAISRGNLSAAVCSDCHNSHDILPASDSQSSIFKSNIPATCGKCHSDISAEYTQSVHGQAVMRGVSRSPACTDCHGIHSIKQPYDPATSIASQAIATGTCTQCHEGVTLTQEFGVPGGRVSSYRDSYHGLASQLGSKVAANCASCHGVHNILPSTDAKSTINANNLQQTCGQCHPGASRNFTRGKIHLVAGASTDIASRDMSIVGTRWVRWIYVPLIILTIGGMLLHNFLVWRKKAAERRRHEARPILRLTLNQRGQHWLLMISFVVLVLSGFALQYPESWLAWLAGSSEYFRRLVHRVAAIVMLAVGAYHVAYLLLTAEGRKWLWDMLPRWKDVTDVFGNLGYYLGISPRRPKIARFGYGEKAEYWAVIWGTMVMGLTGLMIWFKLGAFGFLARWWIDIALAVHFYEAVLATLAIIVWHFYNVIFDPDVYPVNWAFYDGRMSEELYKEEHELDYEKMKNDESASVEQDESAPGGGINPTPAESAGD